MRIEGQGLAQRCGRCGHVHEGPITGSRWPVCGCGCDTFDLHPDEIAQMERAQEVNDRWFGGRALIPGQAVHALAAALAQLEQRLMARIPWDGPAALGVFKGTYVPDGGASVSGRPILPLCAQVVPLPVEMMRQADGDPAAAVCLVVDRAERDASWFDGWRKSARLPATEPVVGWWLLAEADMLGAAGEKVGEFRQMLMVDADERVYDIARARPAAGEPEQTPPVLVNPLPVYTAAAAPMLLKGLTAAGPTLPVPAGLEGILRLQRLTRQETQVRVLLNNP